MTKEYEKKPWQKHIEKEVNLGARESEESEEEDDAQDTKVPKNNPKNQRK